MAVTVTVRLPAGALGPDAPAWCDRHLAVRTDEPERVRRLADVLHGECPEDGGPEDGGPEDGGPDGPLEEVWRRHPGCAVLAVRGPDGLLRVRFRGGALTLRPVGALAAAPAALVGSLVHALLSAPVPRRGG
ncbi:hypothetical protein [Kitasatospora phosalacinea]|uniref:Uncharacterized protein n=1 Tax=Kitasatospora phosalacinea TaxID=2065 RepID=A0A9W6PCD7_9ACTN|nr:hypothetical protein [Kitasatospora phosalacinea]GLW52383.1 hypothetical protein Kpho01_03940 [Kitasatospora phosalacinea]